MSDAQCGCQCCPNKNALIISAQVLSIVAFATGLLSGYTMLAWFPFTVFLIALCVFIFHQVLWCVAAPKGVYWALSFLDLFVAFGSIGSGIWYFTSFWYFRGLEHFGILWIVSGVFWLIAAILEFVYLCKKDESKENTVDEEDNLDEESGNQRHTREEGVAVAPEGVAVAVKGWEKSLKM